MNAFTQVREYAQRSTATEILRKLGLKPHDYNTFITKDDETGRFLLAHDAAVAHAEALKKPNGKVVKKLDMDAPVTKDDIDESAALEAARPARPAAKTAAAPAAAKRTVTSVALELIRAGKTNAQVFDALNAEFKIGDAKKTYPAWYRRHLKIKFGEDYASTAK